MYKKSGPMYLSWSKKKSSRHNINDSSPPDNKKFELSLFSIMPESELNKVIEADIDHIKIPKLEINPTPIGYPHVWARSRITNVDVIPNELDKPIIDKYINIGVMIDEDIKIRVFFFMCLSDIFL